jgi:TPR repeat protein
LNLAVESDEIDARTPLAKQAVERVRVLKTAYRSQGGSDYTLRQEAASKGTTWTALTGGYRVVAEEAAGQTSAAQATLDGVSAAVRRYAAWAAAQSRRRQLRTALGPVEQNGFRINDIYRKFDACEACDESRLQELVAEAARARAEHEANIEALLARSRARQEATCHDERMCQEYCETLNRAYSCFRLGDLYFNGDGVRKDVGRALTYFQKACDAGDGDGCSALGFAYGRGTGVAKNWSTATTLLKKACAVGMEGACNAVPNAECIAAAKTPKQRRPGDDAKCAAAKGQRANILIVDPKKTYVAYETPDVNKLDVCFDAMRSEGCYQINIIARDTSIDCCP